MNLANYLDQHKRVETEITTINSLIDKNDIEQNAGDIARHISTLAGILKVHLSMEDNYLYPDLQKSEDEEVKNLAVNYQKEMGDLAVKLAIYKDKYNTKSKIMQNQATFKEETTNILREIEQRLHKEEKELYNYI